MKTYTPLGNRVVIEISKPPEKTKGGLVLPEDQELRMEGLVLAVGDGELVEKSAIKKGDTVLFGQYAGDEVKNEVNGQMLCIVPLEDVLAIINE